MSTRSPDWRMAYALLLPVLFALLMVRDASQDVSQDASPVVSPQIARDTPAAVATRSTSAADLVAANASGENQPTDLRDALIALAVETLLVCAILRPWAYQRRSRRSLVAVSLLVPWTVVQAQGIRHAGGVVQLHLFWLVLLDALLLLLVLLRFARRGDEV